MSNLRTAADLGAVIRQRRKVAAGLAVAGQRGVEESGPRLRDRLRGIAALQRALSSAVSCWPRGLR